ncbi:sickle tail protein isoform X3 [Trichomycterus rosablanca]|uniref:sickle tail protein isoform X3 n=1 Tax=Trichomycterus rosablanca TaxID=2290929 RepID=UPI002F355BF8
MEIAEKRGEAEKCRRDSSQEEPPKGNLKITSPENTEHHQTKQSSGNAVTCTNGSGTRGNTKPSRGAGPRRHTVGGARSSQEILAMQPSDMDKKREAFLEHLKQKYPHHASVIMGHQERLREQNQSARTSVACSSPVPTFSDHPDQGSLASLDALEVMSECDVPVAFTRGSRTRASLPVVRSANQTKDRSLGVLYLQYGDDTKQIRMPNEITSSDTVRALFVSAFPQQLSMKMLESPSTAIYVKDDMRNMYYELSDVRSITDQSCLKVYHKDPAHAFSHAARPTNGDARMHREMMYASRDGPPLIRQHSQGPPGPPSPHSMPPSPSRIPFGPRPSSGGATMSRERAGHPLTAPTRSASPSSAILERRDVKPDEDVAAKGIGRPGEGHYGEPFLLHHHAVPSDTLDHAYHRASIRSYGVPGMPVESVEHHSLFRQKSWKTPPASPHRMGEMRMMEIHNNQSQGNLGLERASPVRQSFRKDGPIAVDKGRNTMGSPVTPDIQSHCSPVPSGDPQTRDRSVKSGSPVHSMSSTGGSPVLGSKVVGVAPDSSPTPSPHISSPPVQVNLLQFRKNISELRLQLHEMRQLQLQNQERVRAQIKQVEQEIGSRLADALRRQEDPAHRQRTLVEEDRHRYLSMEEKVLTQLGDLEHYVESLKKDSNPSTTPRVVALKEVEEGAVGLRKVGEGLAGLKGEFPGLQARMRALLRVEVEAVKFLKEEPHKLDSILKRVKTLTDALGTLRRCATDGSLKPLDPVTTTTFKVSPATSAELQDALLEPQSLSLKSDAPSSSPKLSSSISPRQSQQMAVHLPTPEATTKQSNNSKKFSSTQPEHTPTSSNHSNGAARIGAFSVGVQDSMGSPSLFREEIVSHSKSKSRATSIEAAEREWEEKRQNIGHYNGLEFERMLQEAEANMLRGTPSLKLPDEGSSLPSPVALPPAAQQGLLEKAESSVPLAQESKKAEVPRSEKPTKTGPEKALRPQQEKPAKSAASDRPLKPNLTIKTNLERGVKSQDKAAKLSQGSEKTSKSPPPPPPRKNYTNHTGMTTTRSGDFICTSRKESGSAQEKEIEVSNPTPQPKQKNFPEAKAKSCTPPPVTASAIQDEEEDEGDKIMAELQVFQKCSIKDIGLKGLVEPQIIELRPGVLLPLKDKKQNTENQEKKDLITDENGNNTVRHSPGVIYYVTAQISKEPPEDSTDHKAASQSSSSQNASVASPTSRMPVPMSAKARQQTGASDRERAGKQPKLQDSQRQFRQANGSAKRSGGDPKSTSPTMPASKIPAFSSSTGKGASQSDTANPINSSSKSSIPSPRSIPAPSSHIPSHSNGSLKIAPPTHNSKGLSLSSQTPNGRPSSSFSSSSHPPLSATMLSQGAKSVRTIHTPSFVSYSRPHNGSAGKSAIPTATGAKEAS